MPLTKISTALKEKHYESKIFQKTTYGISRHTRRGDDAPLAFAVVIYKLRTLCCRSVFYLSLRMWQRIAFMLVPFQNVHNVYGFCLSYKSTPEDFNENITIVGSPSAECESSTLIERLLSASDMSSLNYFDYELDLAFRPTWIR